MLFSIMHYYLLLLESYLLYGLLYASGKVIPHGTSTACFSLIELPHPSASGPSADH